MPDTPLSPSWTRFAADSPVGLPRRQGAGRSLSGMTIRGRYRFGRRIGAGGMANVYEGEFTPLARRVALKVLDVRAGEETRRRFRREFKLLATIDHPGLVRALDIDETDDGRLFYAMERLEGRSLDRVFDLGEQVDPVRVLRIGIQVCDALHALHGQGVVHRDIKPSNVFRLEGTDDQIKILDLGIARLTTGYYEAVDEELRTPTSQRERTRTGVIMGTQGYEPPESGRVKAEPRHDIYSTGVMLFRLLTAKRPSPPGQTPVRVTAFVPDLPTALADAIDRAIAFDPRERFSNVRELQEALEAVFRELTERTPWPRAASEPPARASWLKSWWGGLSVGLACGVVVTAALVLPGEGPGEQNKTEVSVVPVSRVAPEEASDAALELPRSHTDRREPVAQARTPSSPSPEVVEPEPLEAPTPAVRNARGKLTDVAFRRAMKTARGSLLVCMNMYPPGEVPTSLTIRVRVADGEAERVTIAGAPPPAMVTTCVEQAVQEVSFPRGRARVTRSYVFKP